MDEKVVRERLEELRNDLTQRAKRNPSSSRSSSGRKSAGGELEDVERAIRALEKGTYGICEACGQMISPDRLDAYPASRYCLEDQRRLGG
jgi:RNA polymerase-binding transcription factor